MLLSSEPLESICQLRTFVAFVRQLRDEQRERLAVAGDAERAGVDRLETGVANERRRDLPGAIMIAAVEEARTRCAFENVEQHLARDGVEREHDLRRRHFLRQRLGAG